jgi:hypothetical protein
MSVNHPIFERNWHLVDYTPSTRPSVSLPTLPIIPSLNLFKLCFVVVLGEVGLWSSGVGSVALPLFRVELSRLPSLLLSGSFNGSVQGRRSDCHQSVCLSL